MSDLFTVTMPGQPPSWNHMYGERKVWEYDPMAMTNTIDVFISNLRRKLEQDGEPRLLHTKRGAGYVLREPR